MSSNSTDLHPEYLISPVTPRWTLESWFSGQCQTIEEDSWRLNGVNIRRRAGIGLGDFFALRPPGTSAC